ncbi:helix-turn-helix domain-containing protein [Amycolatopsis cynarae]|uniref:Helix-turn-helix domain-containing protein n=1 Tax=Amycolatopsis cynarae TaxID=2995223 RepID=A0ABY7B8S7_9PSEU|nr:helix-turn-helix domain-containing protein [Amycolatopsis sp. HUAS 11-8]WAL68760.1 helix-turn-helix domain-containing protein [Amycolatopsis sp. HUAS 11-8]
MTRWLSVFLCRNAGRTCDRSTLMRRVCDLPPSGPARTTDVHIRKLRLKLPVLADSVATVRGVGYRFDGTPLVRLAEPLPHPWPQSDQPPHRTGPRRAGGPGSHHPAAPGTGLFSF